MRVLRCPHAHCFSSSGHVYLDAPPREVGRQRAAPGRSAARVPAHWRLARVHLDRLGDRTGLVRELLQGKLQLPRIDALGFLAEHPLAEHVELVPQRGVFTLEGGDLVLQGGDQRASGGQLVEGGVAARRVVHH